MIASGLVPPRHGRRAPAARRPARAAGGQAGHGIEIVSKVNDIPKGSRLAVSTNLLACLIAVCMRATRPDPRADRRAGGRGPAAGGRARHSGRVAGRLGRRLAGFGRRLAGHQADPRGARAAEGDPEFGISRGCLLPRHHVFGPEEVPPETRAEAAGQPGAGARRHGAGRGPDSGDGDREDICCAPKPNGRAARKPSAFWTRCWTSLRRGDMRGHRRMHRAQLRRADPDHHSVGRQPVHRGADPPGARGESASDFWGFWMLGGMSGGGMGFLFAPRRKAEAQERMARDHARDQAAAGTRRAVRHGPGGLRFRHQRARHGGRAARGGEALLPAEYYTLTVPALLRTEVAAAFAGAARRTRPVRRRLPRPAAIRRHGAAAVRPPAAARPRARTEGRGRSLDGLLDEYGFDRVQHEQIQADLRDGRIGLAQNRLPASSRIEECRRMRLVRCPCRAAAALWRTGPGGAGRRARWRWCRWRAASAAAGPRAREW